MTTLTINLQLTIQDPKFCLDKETIDVIKRKVELATQGQFAKEIWQLGEFQDAEVTNIQVIKSYEF